jgi:hypothetical protein
LSADRNVRARFLARLIHFVLTDLLGHTAKSLWLVASLANLDKGITAPRRVHRFFKEGRDVVLLLKAVQSAQLTSGMWYAETVRLAALLSFTLHDHVTWFYAAGVFADRKDGAAERAKHRGLRSILLANFIAFGLTLHKLNESFERELALVALVRKYKKELTLQQQQHDQAAADLAALRSARSELYLSLVKDCMDLHVAVSNAELGGFRNAGLNRGVVALFGLIAAGISIRQSWIKTQ